MYYVNTLISMSDDINEQIEILKKHLDHEEVKYYLELLDNDHLSPYMRWYVDKYLFNRKVGKKPKKTYNCKLYRYYIPGYEVNKFEKKEKVADMVK